MLILISGLIFIIPALVQIRNYFIVRSPNYLLFALLFGFVILDQVIVSLNNDDFIFQILITISFIAIYSILINMSSDIINNKLPITDKEWKTLAIIILLLTLILKYLIYTEILSSNQTSLRIVIGELFRAFAGYMILYAYKNTKFVIQSDKTNAIRRYWIIAGIMTIGTGISRASIYILVWILSVPLSNDTATSYLDTTAEIIALIGVLSIGIITFYIAIAYPETMLLSHAQIFKASRLYDLVDKIADSKSSDDSSSTDNMDTLLEYITSLPKEFIKKK